MISTRNWKPIKDWANYAVSDHGEVLKRVNGKNKIMKLSDSHGYKRIQLSKNGTRKKFMVHRLMGIAWLDMVKGKDFINHKNGKKDDNRLENLEWCTISENTKHGFQVLGREPNRPWIGKSGKDHNRSKKVAQMKDGKVIKVWGSQREAQAEGFDQRNISACCRGKRKTYKGFEWSHI